MSINLDLRGTMHTVTCFILRHYSSIRAPLQRRSFIANVRRLVIDVSHTRMTCEKRKKSQRETSTLSPTDETARYRKEACSAYQMQILRSRFFGFGLIVTTSRIETFYLRSRDRPDLLSLSVQVERATLNDSCEIIEDFPNAATEERSYRRQLQAAEPAVCLIENRLRKLAALSRRRSELPREGPWRGGRLLCWRFCWSLS